VYSPEVQKIVGPIPDYAIGICCCFAIKQAAFRSKNKDWWLRVKSFVSDWSHISTCLLLFQWGSTKKKPQLNIMV
jgi:hypothetical protein